MTSTRDGAPILRHSNAARITRSCEGPRLAFSL